MTNPLSKEQLAEIAARAEAATSGPWCTDEWEIYTGTEYLPWSSQWIGETCRAEDGDGARADAAFIAAARTDVPALLARVAELEAERHSTNEALDDAVAAIKAKDERIDAQEKALHDALVRVLATEKLRTERDLAEAKLVKERAQALTDVAAWLAEVGETNAAYLVRTVDVPAGGDPR